MKGFDAGTTLKDVKGVKIPEDVAKWIEINKQYVETGYLKEEAEKDSIHFTIYGLWANYPETNNNTKLRIPVLKWLDEDRGNYFKLVDAVRYGYDTYVPRWNVSEGDLVIKRGQGEAKVHFVEALDEDLNFEITGVLLVDGRADVHFEENEVDDFFREYRLLAKKDNLEEEKI
ncbi:hypothetical protein [Vagococcus fluvialis]|uniref:hypothetical protein n=1 Tax=Vagococcus fluvialis TaxID=2738 RepID=UPI001D09BBFB|nr:hypothetical protein [Vagococcus fluvialis]UDM72637.1 hypothetical protein K5L00_14715 [Vagococcus fluvialis]UDM78360.1 hypothetical protein K5K98_14920 [Vagococcus fluvialis]UDM83912.1 hypothetical protein K5K96_14740 [Vagococcus fluvialis]